MTAPSRLGGKGFGFGKSDILAHRLAVVSHCVQV